MKKNFLFALSVLLIATSVFFSSCTENGGGDDDRSKVKSKITINGTSKDIISSGFSTVPGDFAGLIFSGKYTQEQIEDGTLESILNGEQAEDMSYTGVLMMDGRTGYNLSDLTNVSIGDDNDISFTLFGPNYSAYSLEIYGDELYGHYIEDIRQGDDVDGTKELTVTKGSLKVINTITSWDVLLDVTFSDGQTVNVTFKEDGVYMIPMDDEM